MAHLGQKHYISCGITGNVLETSIKVFPEEALAVDALFLEGQAVPEQVLFTLL